MKKYIVLILLSALAMTTLTGCFVTERQRVAEECLLGNQAACTYFSAIVTLEEAEKAKAIAKDAYNASKQTIASTLTPSPTPSLIPLTPIGVPLETETPTPSATP